MRNKITHGTKVNTTREEAVFAYETVVDAIFHFIEGVDNFYRAKGVKEGRFINYKCMNLIKVLGL